MFSGDLQKNHVGGNNNTAAAGGDVNTTGDLVDLLGGLSPRSSGIGDPGSRGERHIVLYLFSAIIVRLEAKLIKIKVDF